MTNNVFFIKWSSICDLQHRWVEFT